MSTITKQAVQAVADLKAGYTLGHADVVILNELARIALASIEAEPYGYVHKAAYEKTGSCGLSNDREAYRDSSTHVAVYTSPPAPVSVPDEDLLHMAASAIDDLLSNKDRSGAGVWADIPAKLRRAAMLQGADGNSPVIPDGWQLVPKKITLEMECALSRADSYEIGWRWALAAAPTHSGTNDGWVACSERMPGMGVDVLACTISPIGGFEEIETAQWHGGMKGEQPVFITSADAIEPTHWMPLPAAPKQELK